MARNTVLHGWATTWHGFVFSGKGIGSQGLGRWPSLSQRQATLSRDANRRVEISDRGEGGVDAAISDWC
jgi:hypothetical protein